MAEDEEEQGSLECAEYQKLICVLYKKARLHLQASFNSDRIKLLKAQQIL